MEIFNRVFYLRNPNINMLIWAEYDLTDKLIGYFSTLQLSTVNRDNKLHHPVYKFNSLRPSDAYMCCFR